MRQRKTREELFIALNKIRQMKVDGNSDAVIMEELKIDRKLFWYYQDKIYQQDKERLAREHKQILEHGIFQLTQRIEASIKNLNDIATNSEVEPKDRIEAERLKIEAAVNAFKVIREGPEVIDHRPKQAAISPEIV